MLAQIKNRESAARSRAKRQEYTATLEQQVRGAHLPLLAAQQARAWDARRRSRRCASLALRCLPAPRRACTNCPSSGMVLTKQGQPPTPHPHPTPLTHTQTPPPHHPTPQVEELKKQNTELRHKVITAVAAPPDPHAGELEGELMRRTRTGPF